VSFSVPKQQRSNWLKFAGD